MILRRTIYRMGQFFDHLQARLEQRDHQVLEALLNPAQRRLFYQMSSGAQRHSLKVYHALRGAGWRDQELLVAALLHDVGKGSLGLPQRVLVVLLGALSPHLPRHFAPLSPSLFHPSAGAKLVEAAGASGEVVRLVQLHEAGDIPDARLHALQAADEAN